MLNKLIILIIFISLVGCNSTKTTTVKTRIIHDTIIYHEVKDIKLPTKNITIINNPCKDSILKPIHQTVKTEHAELIMKSDTLGNLIIEQNIDSIVNSRVSEILKHTDVQESKVEVVKIKYRVPKWAWILLVIVVIYIAYRFARKSIPFLKVLPY